MSSSPQVPSKRNNEREVRIRSVVRSLIAGVLSLAVPGLIGADLVNTASVSYRDPAGAIYTAISNTVTVAVGTPSVDLPTPDLSGLDGKTFTLQDTLSLVYSGNATSFNWEFYPLSATASSASLYAQKSNASPGQAAISTPAPKLSFGTLNLPLGVLTLKVQAANGSQTSAWASATITLVGTDLSGVQVYPNPWRRDKHEGHPITFAQLTGNVTIEIFTVSAHRIKTLGPASGTITWNLDTDTGDSAASGLYLYLITDDQGNKTSGKLAVIH
jgi:hypothetical protein